MSKKSQALIDAELKIEEQERLLEQLRITHKSEIEMEQRRYEYHLRQVEFLLSIIQDKTVVSQFLKDEAGRLISESTKLRN